MNNRFPASLTICNTIEDMHRTIGGNLFAQLNYFKINVITEFSYLKKKETFLLSDMETKIYAQNRKLKKKLASKFLHLQKTSKKRNVSICA